MGVTLDMAFHIIKRNGKPDYNKLVCILIQSLHVLRKGFKHR